VAGRPADDERTHYERMVAGDLYIADDPRITEQQAHGHALMETYNSTPVSEKTTRRRLLEQILEVAGIGVEIRSPFFYDYGTNITVGDRTFVNFGLVALDVAKIVIGDDCQLGPNVQLLTPSHPIDPEPRRGKWESAAPITIGNNVWLGGGAIVLPGVTIGNNSVIGAGSVVTHDLPADVVAVGSPAKVIRQLS
jgi:maltose O-acetyltransferase